MLFEDWLWTKYERNSSDIADRFAKKFMTNNLAFNWPFEGIQTRDQLQEHIKSVTESWEADKQAEALYAARIVWTDYEKEILNFC